MPLVACPKCSTNLRVPDGTSAAVRCPKCQTVFQPPKPAQPAFEVVDEEPVVQARPAPSSAARPAPPAKPAADEFEVVDEKKSTRSGSGVGKALSLDDDEDDDQPRSRRRSRDDDDDDDDRPRSRKRSRDYDDEDDDDEDDRRRKRRKGRRDDYDEPSRAGKGSLGLARVGLLLILISLGLYLGGIAFHSLFLFIAWLGGVIPNGLILVTGLLGLANWIVALVGLGLSIAGPYRSRGLAIAATSVAVVHLVLAFVVANDRDSALFSSHTIQQLSAMNRAESLQDLQKELTEETKKNPNSQRAKDIQEEIRSRIDDRRDSVDVDDLEDLRSSRSKMRWGDLTTTLPQLDQFIAILSYSSDSFSDYLLSMFAGLAELARFILLALLIGSLASAARIHGAADKAKIGWIAGAIAALVCMLVVLLTAVILDSYRDDFKKIVTGAQSSPQPGNYQDWRQQQEQRQAEVEKMQDKFRSLQKGIKNWSAAGELLIYLIHGGILILPALAALQAYTASSRRP